MIGTYQVIGWGESYENSRSRGVKDLNWVPVPNRHDGEGFSLVMAHKDGAKIFAAWILILQVASKCETRGILARENGKPHTAESLAIKTRGNVEWFRIALDFLSSEDIGWLHFEPDSIEQSSEYQYGDTHVSGNCQLSAEERKKEGKEQKELLLDFFNEIKKGYPARKGDQGWKEVETRIKAIPVKDREDVIQGIIGYRKHCEETEKIGTPYVKQASTFLSPSKEIWKEYIPNPSEIHLVHGVDFEWVDNPDGSVSKVFKVSA